jgi:ABC-2 type transport system permease protein
MAARITTLVWLRARTSRNAFRALRSHSNLKVIVIAVMALAIWGGLFGVFWEGFTYLNDHFGEFKSVIVEPILGVIFGVFFLSMLVLLLFSNAIIAYGSLYRGRETAYLFTRPYSAWTVYLYKLTECLLFSSWAFLFLALPLIVAFGITEGAPWYYYPGALLFFGSFALLPAAFGGLATLFVGRFLTNSPKRVVAITMIFTLAVITLFFVGIAGALNQGASAQGEVGVQAVLSSFSISANPLLPSHWAADGVLSLAAGGFRDAANQLLLLITNGLFFGMVGVFAARMFYAEAYHRVQSRGRQRNVRRADRFYRGLEGAMMGIDPHMRLLLVKDVKTFLRDPIQWSQVLLFFGLLAIYFLNIRSFRYDLTNPFWGNFICIMNLAATSLTLSTFTCRFIYPLLSLEGKKFWVLGLLPLDRRKILYSKYWFAFIGAFCISESLIVVSDLMLKVDLMVMALHAITVLILCSGLSGLAVGVGATYPNLKEENPSKIVSGFGGTLNLVLSLIFVLLTIGLAVVPYHLSAMMERFAAFQEPGLNRAILLIGMLLAVGLGVAATFVPLRIGERAFERLEV